MLQINEQIIHHIHVMNVHEKRKKLDQAREVASVYCWDLADSVQRKAKPTLETRSSKKQACWWQVNLRARWIWVSQTWLTGRTRGLPVVLQDGLGVHLLWMTGKYGHHHQASHPILSHGRTHVTFDVPEGRNAPSLLHKTHGWWASNEYQLSHIGENVAVTHRQHCKEVFWVWSCTLWVGNPHVHLCL